jgi:hypothetical protein
MLSRTGQEILLSRLSNYAVAEAERIYAEHKVSATHCGPRTSELHMN